MKLIRHAGILCLSCFGAACALGAADAKPWLNAKLSPDKRAQLAVAAMTLPEKITLLHGALPFQIPGREPTKLPPEAILAAGYIPGLPRLGIPALLESDASLGVVNPYAPQQTNQTRRPDVLRFSLRFLCDASAAKVHQIIPLYSTGAAVIVAPGGGFLTLSIESEGEQLAKWLTDHGSAVPAFSAALAVAIRGRRLSIRETATWGLS